MRAILFFLGVYAFMSNGTFAFLKYSRLETRTQLKGRGFSMPAAAAAFTILLFSLGGIPPTGGFLAKLLLLWRAVDAQLPWPAAIGALSALISLSYYLGMTRELWFEAPQGPGPKPGERAPSRHRVRRRRPSAWRRTLVDVDLPGAPAK